jgi:hypothetical protein
VDGLEWQVLVLHGRIALDTRLYIKAMDDSDIMREVHIERGDNVQGQWINIFAPAC